LARSKETRIHSVVSDQYKAAGCHTARLVRSDYPTPVFRPAIDPTTGAPIAGIDRSVRPYFHTGSSGLADLDVVVLPAQTIAEKNVLPEGLSGAAIVMLGGPGGGSTRQFSNFAWSRFCMSDNLGNCVGEILHPRAPNGRPIGHFPGFCGGCTEPTFKDW
jgi:hypothetical protein